MGSSINQDRLLALVSDGSLADLRSIQLCEVISECFSGNKAVVITSNDGDLPWVNAFGVDNQSVHAYETYFYQLDPMNSCRSPNIAMTMSETVPKKCFESSEFYNDFFKPMGSYHSLSLERRIQGERKIEVAINRSRQSAGFTAADKRHLKDITARIAARTGVIEAEKEIPADYRKEKLDLLSTLSVRELEVFLHISSGCSLTDFTSKHQISINTARTLLKSVRTKLDCNSQLELCRIAKAIAQR